MLMKMEQHAELIPLYKELYRVPEYKLERKFKEKVPRLLTNV